MPYPLGSVAAVSVLSVLTYLVLAFTAGGSSWSYQAAFATLQDMIRPGDAVGRLGGDEFAVLFSEIEPEDAHLSAERIRRALSERAPSSIGLATFPHEGSDLEELTRRADSRLYASRRHRSERQPAHASDWREWTAARTRLAAQSSER